MSKNDLYRWAVERGIEIRMTHIEAMVAAYFSKTNIPPDEVELVEEQHDNRIVWYFRRREPNGRTGTKPTNLGR